MATPILRRILPKQNIPTQTFEHHASIQAAIAFVRMREACMVTSLVDGTISLWNLKQNVPPKGIKVHSEWVRAVAVTRPGNKQSIASGDDNGELIIWDGDDTVLSIHAHSNWIYSLDFSPDGNMLASGSEDKTMKLWSTSTWELRGNPINCGAPVKCVRYSPNSGEFIAVGTKLGIQIYSSAGDAGCIAEMSHLAPVLAWMPNNTRLFSGGHFPDCTIREWDSSTWQQVGDPWNGHTNDITAIAVSPNGSLVVSASVDKEVRLWGLDQRQTIMIFEHSDYPRSVVFTSDSKHIFSGGDDKKISKWAIPEDVVQRESRRDFQRVHSPARETPRETAPEELANIAQNSGLSFVVASKSDWDRAIYNARQSNITPSLTGWIAQAIVLCEKQQLFDAMKAFHQALMCANGDSKIIYFLLLIEAIAFFNAHQHEGALLRVRSLAAAYSGPSVDTPACRAMEACLRVTLGINALNERRYNEAIDHLTAAVGIDSFSAIHSTYEDIVVLFAWDLEALWKTANQKLCEALVRGNAMLERKLLDKALFNAEEVIQLNPSSYLGYQLEHAALHGLQQYDGAIEAFQDMLSKLENADDIQLREWRKKYFSQSKAASAIRKVIAEQLEKTPIRVLNTATGLLCNRFARMNTFMTLPEYKELVSLTMMHADHEMEHVKEVVKEYFQCVMLSHRWEDNEPLLQDIEKNDVYTLSPVGGISKLQSFCSIAKDEGYRWAWSDTCCIDKSSNTELQESLNAMFVWYRHSVLTIVYLSDVPPSFEPGALRRSEWHKRGWTVQEFLAPVVVRFFQKDWTLYLGDDTPNHKNSTVIRQELEKATRIHSNSFLVFQPGMEGVREKLQWASTRVTTVPEDIAYSLFGVFRVQLPIMYGEGKQDALGRLLQEIVARSGDITVLDWVGQSSGFNSCLPADISSYKAAPHTIQSSSAFKVETLRSLLGDSQVAKWASKLYTELSSLDVPRFANCRLRLPCIAFRVTEIRMTDTGYMRNHKTSRTYAVKADGLQDLSITTAYKIAQLLSSSREILLVRPWDRGLLQSPVSADVDGSQSDDSQNDDSQNDDSQNDDSQSDDSFLDASEVLGEYGESEIYGELLAHIGQPFSAFLLGEQRRGEYKRIASDQHIVAQVKDMASHDLMIRTVEIL